MAPSSVPAPTTTCISHLLVLLSVAACVTATPRPPEITHFTLVNPETNATIRRLTPNAVITTSHPFCIVAHVSSSPRRYIRFTHPFPQTERHEPYAIPANFPNGNLRPLDLSPGSYRATANVDGNLSTTVSVPFQIRPPSLPPRGPLPHVFPPAFFASPELARVRIPTQAAQCGTVGVSARMRVLLAYLGESFVDRSRSEMAVSIKWCDMSQRVRVRVLSYIPYIQSDNSTPYTIVEFAEQRDLQEEGLMRMSVDRFCQRRLLYAEVCARLPGGLVSCGTTVLTMSLRIAVRVPRPVYTGPTELELAPGDLAEVTLRFANRQVLRRRGRRDGYGNGGLDVDDGVEDFVLQMLVMSQEGVLLGRSAVTDLGQDRVSLSIGETPCGVQSTFDKAIVFARFAHRDCPNVFDDLRERFGTVVKVSTETVPLLRQDSKLPTIVRQPRFPPTVWGASAVLHVSARNDGGGMRRDTSEGGEMATRLRYQWYVRREMGMDVMTFAEKVENATQDWLRIDEVACGDKVCGRGGPGCRGLLWYYVEVCNTFGCKMSRAIEPVVLPPLAAALQQDGLVWDERTCRPVPV